MQKRRIKRQKQNTRKVFVLLIVAATIMMVGFIALNNLTSANAPQVTFSPAMDQCGGTTCGQANAPVTIEIFSDFQ